MGTINELHQRLEDGLVGLLYAAEQVARVEDELARSVDLIRSLGFEEFFALVQRELIRARILYIAQIYDPVNPRFASYSLPAILEYLDTHAGSLPIKQKDSLVSELLKRGSRLNASEALDEATVTRAFVSLFRSRLPLGGSDDSHPLSAPLRANKTLRDKTVVHPESVTLSDLPKPTYEDHDQLLGLAKEFLGLISFAYFNTADMLADGSFPSDAYAIRSANSLRRMLEKLSSSTGNRDDD